VTPHRRDRCEASSRPAASQAGARSGRRRAVSRCSRGQSRALRRGR
jgi:hypothetical protein